MRPMTRMMVYASAIVLTIVIIDDFNTYLERHYDEKNLQEIELQIRENTLPRPCKKHKRQQEDLECYRRIREMNDVR